MSEQQIKKTTVRELVKRNIISGISTLRMNQNNYPYVTLLNKKGEAHNLYFGKKTSEVVSGTFSKGDQVVDFLVDAEVIETKNEKGEIRYKLSKSTSDYLSEQSLLDKFNLSDKDSSFSFEIVTKEFTPKTEAVPQP